jgi:GNAT superfamily N-acetyltransferase
MLDINRARQIFEKIRQYPNYEVFVAQIGEEIVGTFAFLVMDNLAHNGLPAGVIEDVVVTHSQRNKGIGKAMMVFAIERAKEYRCYKVALSSSLKRTDAHKFYEKLGFEVHGYSFSLYCY